MPGFFDGFFDAIRDFFGGGDDDSGDDDDGALLDPDDWEGETDVMLDPGELGNEFISDEGHGEQIDLPAMDYETALAYCSDAPDGVLFMVLEYAEDGEEYYSVWRDYEG